MVAVLILSGIPGKIFGKSVRTPEKKNLAKKTALMKELFWDGDTYGIRTHECQRERLVS